MKFHHAAGILVAQHPILPTTAAATTSSSSSTTLERTALAWNEKEDQNVLQLLLPVLHKYRYLGKKSQRREHTLPPYDPPSRGVLQNSPSHPHHQECDPLSLDPDVGIFSCNTPHSHCEPVEDSRLGGNCIGAATPTPGRQLSLGVGTNRRRHLVVSPSDAGVCLPDHPAYQAYDCDCLGFDNVTGTGIVPCVEYSNFCLGDLDPGCEETCVTVTLEYSFTDFAAPGYTNCFTITTPYSQVACFEERFEEETCTLTFNNVTCTSCEIVPRVNSYLNFDCSNAAGGLKGSTAKGLEELLPILKRCSALGYCDLCGSGQYVGRGNYGLALTVPAPAGYEETLFTCGDLTYSAYENVTMDRDVCTDFAVTAQTSACCVPTVLSEPSYDCSLCGDGRELYQDTMVEILGYTLSCADLIPLLNDTVCNVSGPLLAPTCCEPEPDASSAIPTAAPGTLQPHTSSNPASGAASVVSIRFIHGLLAVSVTVGGLTALMALCGG